ncbi:unnamed protein product [Litomosoides sigmodontis]|uniref:Phorbol-ester/DAG-type domain-containing protein n=1 Tax=Litomosoides sigmodontis TaxID=42156 RepID=A0A3P6T8Q2_LITSI|nr:unnamed protein product [Litomosoides sigmodontis]
MLEFLWGVLVGVVLVVFVIYILLFNPFGEISSQESFVDQFQPLRLPEELRVFLKEGGCEEQVYKWESCFNLSLILHFLFQEHKDTRRLRRWIHKKLQLELSDLTARNTAGRFIQDIRIRNLSVGSRFPVIKAVRVEDCELSQDENFKTLKLLVDVDYSGGFQCSVDVSMLFGRFAQLSIKLTRLSGKIRLKLTRDPFTHWVFAFVDMPTLEFQIDSRWQGKQVKHLIPIITQNFRRMVQRKHVWPNYKIRYRPLFPNPLYQPSPCAGAFEYIKTTGLLEVTVLQCTRLNTALVSDKNSEVFCVVSVDRRPIMQDASRSSTRCITVLLNFSRHGISESIGLTFSKFVVSSCLVLFKTIVPAAAAEGVPPLLSPMNTIGDVVLAVNNVPVTSERQLNKLLSGTSSELSVLVDRITYEKGNVLHRDDSSSVGDFDEISVSEIFENVENKSKEVEVTEKGNRRRSRSSTGISSNVTSNDFTVNVLKGGRMFPPHTDDGDFMSKSSDLLKMVETERDCVMGKRVHIKRARSEAEIASTGYPNREKQKRLFTSSLENLSYYVHKQCEEIRTVTNMMEDCVMVSTISKEKGDSVGNLNVDISAEDCTKDFQRSPSRRQRLQARAAEMAAAGKARMSDFWYRHKDGGSGAEVGVDALSQHDIGLGERRGAARLMCSEISCDYVLHNLSLTAQSDECDDVCDLSKAPRILTTKSLATSEDVRWNQSLRFELDTDTCKYLNVIVQARPLTIKAADVTISQDSQIERDGSQMLGYASIYIPQVIDDCQLTLSNRHQELFTLRPPFWTAARRPLTRKAADESRRAGFDERLCYGDVVLGFHYFPTSPPTSVENRSNVEDTGCVKGVAQINKRSSLETSSEIKHNFETILLKGTTVCAVCRRKVWLKMASHCTSCLLVCHNKCVPKVESFCSQHPPVDDSVYDVSVLLWNSSHGFKIRGTAVRFKEEWVTYLFARIYLGGNVYQNLLRKGWLREQHEFLNGHDYQVDLGSLVQKPTLHAFIKNIYLIEPEEQLLSRRRRIAVKVSERLSSTWRSVGRKRVSFHPLEEKKIRVEQKTPIIQFGIDDVVPVEKAIPDVFSMLKLSENLNQMMYQPGNAYNEQMMEKIRSVIHQTTTERLNVMKSMKDTQSYGSLSFATLEDRLQALAVLMLHYCAALQNCIDLEESCKHQDENKNIADASQDKQDTNAFSRDEESEDGKYVTDPCNKFEEFYDCF